MTKPQTDKDKSFVRYVAEHERANTIQHWQLRDLVSFDSDPNFVYCVHKESVMRYSLRTKQAQHVLSKACRGPNASGPTTFSVQGGYLATGTDKGELSVYRLNQNAGCVDAERISENVVTSSQEVLNNLNIVAHNHVGTRLYASGNDKTVRCYALPSMVCLDTAYSNVAVNHSAEDPSGKMLITLGDDDTVRLFQRDSSGKLSTRHELKVSSIDPSNACGMCCAWHPWGNCFATAFQCGQVAVWDARTHKVVAKHQVQHAVRTVKFSDICTELMAFAEHEQQFHVVDARHFGCHQTVQAASAGVGISGLTFAPGGTRLFVGIDQRGLQEYDVDTVHRHGFSFAAST